MGTWLSPPFGHDHKRIKIFKYAKYRNEIFILSKLNVSKIS